MRDFLMCLVLTGGGGCLVGLFASVLDGNISAADGAWMCFTGVIAAVIAGAILTRESVSQ